MLKHVTLPQNLSAYPLIVAGAKYYQWTGEVQLYISSAGASILFARAPRTFRLEPVDIPHSAARRSWSARSSFRDGTV